MAEPLTDRRVTDGPLMDLHDRLMDAIERSDASDVTPAPAPVPMWRSRAVLAAAAVVALVTGLVAVLLSVPGQDPAAADVSVTESGGMVTVVLDGSVSVAELRTALTDAGVTATVKGSVTGPGMVNRFISMSTEQVQTSGADGSSKPTATFRSGDRVVLYLGVAAEPGQPYDSSPAATMPGEPLEGLDIVGRPIGEVRAEIEARADERGVTVGYRDAMMQPTDEPAPGASVVNAISTSSDHVLVWVS